MDRRFAQAFGVVVALLIGVAGGERFGGGEVPTGEAQDSSDVIRVGPFSDMAPGWTFSDGWQRVSMAAAYDTTEYKLIRSEQGVVLRAHSNTGTSGVGRRCRIDLTTHPILEWQWKVEDIVDKGKAGVKGRHDFPARIYVSFDYDGLSLLNRLKLTALRALGFEAVPQRSIVYAWANRVPKDSVVRSPYVEWLRQIAVRSGSTQVDTWVRERRNVRDDYRRLFGEEPPPVNGIAVMTNTGHTEESVTAYYGDIVFRADSLSAPEDADTSTTEAIGTSLHSQSGRHPEGDP